ELRRLYYLGNQDILGCFPAGVSHGPRSMLLGGLWRHQLRRGACQDLHAVNNALLKREEGNQLAQGDNLIGGPASDIQMSNRSGGGGCWREGQTVRYIEGSCQSLAERGTCVEDSEVTVVERARRGPGSDGSLDGSDKSVIGFIGEQL